MLRSVVFGLVFLVSLSAHAFSISPVGVWTASTQYTGPALPNSSSVMGIGGGALWAEDLLPFLIGEAGILFLSHSFAPSPGNTLTYNTAQIPVLVRFNALPMISIGVGGYWGIAVSTLFTGSVNDASVQAIYTGGTRNDYGLLGAIGFKLAVAPFVKLRVDGIYEFGLANISSGSASQNSRNLNVLAGIQFDLG